MVNSDAAIVIVSAGGLFAVLGTLVVPQLGLPWYVQYLVLGLGLALAAIGAHLELKASEETP